MVLVWNQGFVVGKGRVSVALVPVMVAMLQLSPWKELILS